MRGFSFCQIWVPITVSRLYKCTARLPYIAVQAIQARTVRLTASNCCSNKPQLRISSQISPLSVSQDDTWGSASLVFVRVCFAYSSGECHYPGAAVFSVLLHLPSAVCALLMCFLHSVPTAQWLFHSLYAGLCTESGLLSHLRSSNSAVFS